MKREKLVKLGLYAAFLQRRWHLIYARSAGSLRNEFIADYKKKKASVFDLLKIHSKGFSFEDWKTCGGGLNSKNYKRFLSTVDYRRLHPLNGSYSFWIDDKLTFMYLCQSANLKKYILDYYFQISADTALALPDCPKEFRDCGVSGILGCLKLYGELALKKVKSSLGSGFYKAKLIDENVCVNNETMTQDEFTSFVSNLDGYIVMEYLHPSDDTSNICADTANAIRYLVANRNGEPLYLYSCIRFGTRLSGSVDNYGRGGVKCISDEQGNYDGGVSIDFSSGNNINITNHPDTGIQLKGKIPMWSEIQDATKIFCNHFPQLSYLGFDYVVTKQGLKILEINSLSSLNGFQLKCPVFDLQNGWWFKEQLNKINS